MPKPAAIDASTLLASKGSAPVTTGTVQRGQTPGEDLVDLNFKVPRAFKARFKRAALDKDLTQVRLLTRAFEEWLERHA